MAWRKHVIMRIWARVSWLRAHICCPSDGEVDRGAPGEAYTREWTCAGSAQCARMALERRQIKACERAGSGICRLAHLESGALQQIPGARDDRASGEGTGELARRPVGG